MTVTITHVRASDVPSWLWTFNAPEPAGHPGLGNVSVDGAASATALCAVPTDIVEVRVAVTVERRWGYRCQAVSARGRREWAERTEAMAIAYLRGGFRKAGAAVNDDGSPWSPGAS